MARANPGARVHFCLRSRVAEDCLERAVDCGVDQYVILGAGLDSFAYRQPEWARAIEIIEMDHPETQALKLDIVKSRDLGPPQNVTYLPIDFASESVLARLEHATLSVRRPIFVSWLGVTQYLTADAVAKTLDALAKWPSGCGVVLTYMLSDWSEFAPEAVARFEAQRKGAAFLGEPWLSAYSESSISAALQAAGFVVRRSFPVAEMQSRYFAGRDDGLKAEGGPSRIMGAHTAVDGGAWFDLGPL
jgi:methyltransferase (TIGR00027 family)